MAVKGFDLIKFLFKIFFRHINKIKRLKYKKVNIKSFN